MKYSSTVKIILIFLSYLSVSPILANISPFDCPQEIYCDDPVDTNPWGSSCKPVGSELVYQSYMLYEGGTVGTPLKGTYIFAGATIDKHGGKCRDAPSNVVCKYKPASDPDTPFNSFTILSKTSADLQSYMGRNHLWTQYSNKDGSLHADCNSDLSAFCPLIEKEGIIFYNTLITQYRNDEPIGAALIRFGANFNNTDFIMNDNLLGWTMFVPFDRVKSSGCASQCVVKITLGLQDGHGGWNYSDAGTITVDMSNQLKILSVNTSSRLPQNIKMRKGPLNSVMFSTVR